MKQRSRREFLLLGAGAAGTLTYAGLRGTRDARGNPPEALDATFERHNEPRLTLAYPSSWTCVENYVLDLIRPYQLFTITNAEVPPHESRSQNGLPDLSKFASSDVLLHAHYVEDPMSTNEVFSDLPADGVSVDELSLRGDAPASFQYRLGTFMLGDAWILRLFVWVGVESPHSETTDAILQSLRAS